VDAIRLSAIAPAFRVLRQVEGHRLRHNG
jgi:hypothetical protein